MFDHDDKAKALGLEPVERMLYHRRHCKPLMQEAQGDVRGEDHEQAGGAELSALGASELRRQSVGAAEPICEVPGVPLDTYLVEQALITPVRYVAGSFNDQTEDGAVVGDRHMSLIASARANDVEPVAYLTECLRCHEDLAKRPDHYLPWIYRQRLNERDSLPDPARENTS